MGRKTKNGTWEYDAADIQNAASWPDLLNLQQNAAAEAIAEPARILEQGRIIPVNTGEEQREMLKAIEHIQHFSPSQDTPILFYRRDLDMIIACEGREDWKRVAGHSMFHNRLMTKNGSFNLRSTTWTSLGDEFPFYLEADTQLTFGLSTIFIADQMAAGSIYLYLNGKDLGQSGYITSHNHRTRMVYYREWSAYVKRGKNHIRVYYQPISRSNPQTFGTLWLSVRYTSA